MGHKMKWSRLVLVVGLGVLDGCAGQSSVATAVGSTKDCAEMLVQRDIQKVATIRERRFLGKVPDTTARCLGGTQAERLREGPWLDWPNYWASGDITSRAPARLLAHAKVVGPNAHGINGALYDLEVQRIELITFNLFDNNGTYEAYVTGRDGAAGPVLKTWPELRLPQSHPDYTAVGGDQQQVCRGALIRFRNLNGMCNDIRNPLMGSTHQLFARNVPFDTTFPDVGLTEISRNRHGDRLGLLKPDPQVISRTLFTRRQPQPDRCREGYGLPGGAKEAECMYEKAPFFNVLA
ncbi:MAG: peroxidase family protein, partial [Nitrospiraceae bacterium]